jgi:hypothetical protein
MIYITLSLILSLNNPSKNGILCKYEAEVLILALFIIAGKPCEKGIISKI